MRIVGAALISLPFVAIAVVTVLAGGWTALALVVGAVVAVVAVLFAGVNLFIGGGER